MLFKSLAVLLLVGLSVSAAPSTVVRRQSIAPLSLAQVSAFKPFSYFAAAAYCNPAATLTWTCGAACSAHPGFITTASGGDGKAIQFWYVGYDPVSASVIVSHEGTNPSQILADATDVNFFLKNLDSTLFPGLSSEIKVHSGFADEQAKTANALLAAVQTTMSTHNTNTINFVSHSLGAAIGLLDSVYLPLHIPGAKLIYTGYGLPRVGNLAFANYIDSSGISFIRITNLKDPVPILPFEFMGFVHPSNEAHISENGFWESCPGQDNPSTLCSVGDVPNIFVSNESNHDGPYNGVLMGTCLP